MSSRIRPVFEASDSSMIDEEVLGDAGGGIQKKKSTVVGIKFHGESAPTQQEMEPLLILQDMAYSEPDNLSRVAAVRREEADSLLGLNPSGVQEYFKRKGCGDLGERLAEENISGLLLSSLKEKHLQELHLSLGQRLTLAGFLTRFRAAARAKVRNEVLWSSEAKVQSITKVGEVCCFNLLPKCECNCFQKRPVEYLVLPAASYALTSTVLRINDYAWADGHPSRVRQRVFKPNCNCGVLFGWYPMEDPPNIVCGNNVQLTTISDCDFRTSNVKPERYRPTIWERLVGWSRQLMGSPPALVTVKYATNDGEVMACLYLDQTVAKGVADKILLAKDEASFVLNSHGNEI